MQLIEKTKTIAFTPGAPGNGIEIDYLDPWNPCGVRYQTTGSFSGGSAVTAYRQVNIIKRFLGAIDIHGSLFGTVAFNPLLADLHVPSPLLGSLPFLKVNPFHIDIGNMYLSSWTR